MNGDSMGEESRRVKVDLHKQLLELYLGGATKA